jgi:hypothetical protein
VKPSDTVDVGGDWVQVIVDESEESAEAVRAAQDSGLSVFTIPAEAAAGAPVLRVNKRGFEREYYGIDDIRAAVQEIASSQYRNGNGEASAQGLHA